MKYYVGLDISIKETSICVVDETRRALREGKVGSEPETIAAWVERRGSRLSASVSMPALWRRRCMMARQPRGLPVVCLDARHSKAATVKTDRSDAAASLDFHDGGMGGPS